MQKYKQVVNSVVITLRARYIIPEDVVGSCSSVVKTIQEGYPISGRIVCVSFGADNLARRDKCYKGKPGIQSLKCSYNS